MPGPALHHRLRPHLRFGFPAPQAGNEAGVAIVFCGQEKNAATCSLARTSMIPHDNPAVLVAQGNALTDPKLKDGDALKTVSKAAANPTFSENC